VPGDDAHCLERAQAVGERPRAHPLADTLELPEAPRAEAELVDEERRPLRTDDVAGGRDGVPREIDVLELLVQGLTNREIADTLFLSIAVIERHLTNIFRQVVPSGADDAVQGDARRENRRVLTVLEWLRRTGRLSE
jgi:ATP/maltotriose-dependent transcriptional regulator MalT